MRLKRLLFVCCSLSVVAVNLSEKGDAQESFFDQNYASDGIVRPGTDRIAPVVVAPDNRADQMLQTEAKPERKEIVPPSAKPVLTRPKSYPGRFVNRQSGTESRRIPQALGEVGTDLP